MIKFESNTLVLNSFFSEEDVSQIDAFADYVRSQEGKRILKAIEDAPPAMDFFGPYIAKDKLIEFIKGENQR